MMLFLDILMKIGGDIILDGHLCVNAKDRDVNNMDLVLLEKLINKFRIEYKGLYLDKDYYETLDSIEDVIDNAAMAIKHNGKKHEHQHRIKTDVLRTVRNKLINNKNDITKVNNFEDIMGIVKKCSVKGFGKLSCYDTSLRIGFYFKIYPQEVYLHAGTRKGAKGLGVNQPKRSIKKESLPEPLKKLEPYEIEAFFCVYRKELPMCL